MLLRRPFHGTYLLFTRLLIITLFEIRNYIGRYWSFLMQYSSIYLFSHSKVSFNSRTQKEIYILNYIYLRIIYYYYKIPEEIEKDLRKDIMKFFGFFFFEKKK